MKKLILFAAMLMSLPLSMQAQDDDMYFVPTKKKVKEARERYEQATGAYYSGSDRSVDDYNRRAMGSSYEVISADTAASDVIDFSPVADVYPDSTVDFQLTRQMARWDGYTPTDAYWEGYDRGRTDEWRFSAWHSPFYYSSFYPWYDSYWYDPWYYHSWHYAWYDPWYYHPYSWGYYSSWGYRPYYYGGVRVGRHNPGNNPSMGHSGRVAGNRNSSYRNVAGGATGTRRASATSTGRATSTGATRNSSYPRSTTTSSSNRNSSYGSSSSSSSRMGGSSGGSGGGFGGGRSGGIGGGSRAGGRR